ncbi:MAG: hypothetical protein ACRD0P_05600 [Stackebrandtia sp.]
MKSKSWFQCGQTPVATEEALIGLRARLRQVYTSADPCDYSLVVAEVAPETDGFDRLAIRLSYTRILGELTASPALLAGTGLAVALILCDDNLSATLARLRMRLARATTVGRPPRVWLERLPPRFPMALDLLDELSE